MIHPPCMPAKITKNLVFFVLPDEICLILVLSSIHNSTGWSIFCVGKNWPKTAISEWHSAFNINDYFAFSCQVHFGPLLCHVTHDDFSSLILPAVQKVLLRNPEVVLESKNDCINRKSMRPGWGMGREGEAWEGEGEGSEGEGEAWERKVKHEKGEGEAWEGRVRYGKGGWSMERGEWGMGREVEAWEGEGEA